MDFHFGSDIDPSRRLIEDQQFRFRIQPFCQDYFLLISPAQYLTCRFTEGVDNPQFLYEFLRHASYLGITDR